jgi:predicted metal-dependent HD superfamily phosphohydrolase
MEKAQILSELRYRWDMLMLSLDMDEALAAELYDDLVNHYDDDGRFYHDLSHIHKILSVIDEMGGQIQDSAAVKLAAWYHDVIYDVRRSDNEARSAEYAGDVLRRMKIGKTRIASVKQMILATEVDHGLPKDVDSQILSDADLVTLASIPEQYDDNARAIRQEYAFVPEGAFRLARKEILNGFLKRERIFHTETMHKKYEQRARENLRREIAALG